MVAQVDSVYFTTRPGRAVARLLSYALFEGRPITTRGRWVNPLVFALLSIIKRVPRSKGIDRPVFILGAGRSGTTALGTVLSMHREVGFLNEAKALWHTIYPYEDVIGNYSDGTARYRLNAADVTEDIRRNANRLFSTYLSAILSSRLVDKYPELVFRIPFVREIFPDARFILMTRNGFDTAASMVTWIENHQTSINSEVHSWWGVNDRKWKLMQTELIQDDAYYSNVRDVIATLTRPYDRAAVEWIVTMRESLAGLRANAGSIITVRYEDLVRNPRAELSKVMNFAEFVHDETFLQYGESVIRPTKKQCIRPVHEALQPLFEETMAALGY